MHGTKNIAPPSHPTLWPLRFLSVEAASGTVLLAAAALAVAWANSPWRGAYQALWRLSLHSAVLGFLPAHDLHFLVNDALMTFFFLVVGLELRRELARGELRDPRVATLPVLAAIGGVVVPALIYLLLNAAPPARHGWAIPTATDIAFAVAVLSLMRGVPPALRLLLLTLAIVDDIIAILIIAVFYSSGIAPGGLAIAAAGVAAVLLLQRLGVGRMLAYVAPGGVIWLGMLQAGVHPALAGVLLGLLTPARVDFGWVRRSAARPEAARGAPLERAEALLHPYVAFGIMPLFAFANAGVTFRGVSLAGVAPAGVTGGIILGLALGKPLGIVLTAVLAVRARLCALPAGVGWPALAVLGCLGGIGFTMSIFIANLAFADTPLLDAAKLAVLSGSALAAALSFLVYSAAALPKR
jgi:Na+:H+ antiporter, NhaA family